MFNPTDVAELLQAARTDACPRWCGGHYEDVHLSGDRAAGPYRAELAAHGDALTISLYGHTDQCMSVAEAEDLAATLLELAAAARVAS